MWEMAAVLGKAAVAGATLATFRGRGKVSGKAAMAGATFATRGKVSGKAVTAGATFATFGGGG